MSERAWQIINKSKISMQLDEIKEMGISHEALITLKYSGRLTLKTNKRLAEEFGINTCLLQGHPNTANYATRNEQFIYYVEKSAHSNKNSKNLDTIIALKKRGYL